MEIEIINVAGYVEHVLQISRGWNPLYRGHSDKNYELIPSLGRHVKHPDGTLMTPEYLMGRELESLSDFRGDSVPFITHRDRSMFDVMSLAQHHGVPTRLMDWTTNPLVALYFAVRNVNRGTDGIVYIAPPSPPLPRAIRSGEASPFQADQIYSFVPQHIDLRMSAQFSVFTLHPDPYVSIDKKIMKSVWFKGDAKELIIAELHVLGITAQSIFPGLSGIGERIRNSKFGLF